MNEQLTGMTVLARHGLRTPLYDLAPLFDPDAPLAPARGGGILTAKGKYASYRIGTLLNARLRRAGMDPMQGQFCWNTPVRCVQTTRYFRLGLSARTLFRNVSSSGCHPELFTSLLHFTDEAHRLRVQRELEELNSRIIRELAPDLQIFSNLIRRCGQNPQDDYENFEITVEENSGPRISGDFFRAVLICDVLLHYRLLGNPLPAQVTEEEWESMDHIRQKHLYALFGSAGTSANAAAGLLQKLRETLRPESVPFTWLCGHDSNLIAVLSALDIEPAEGARPGWVPDGAMIVFERLLGMDNEPGIRAEMLYFSPEQYMSGNFFFEKKPRRVPLRLKGLEEKGNGCYALRDAAERLDTLLDQNRGGK